MQDRVYLYDTKEKKGLSITLSAELEAECKQALDNYNTSKKYIDSQFTFLWRNAEKRYRLDTQDRQYNKGLKPWQSNITVGTERRDIDIFISSLNENPIVFAGTPVGETEPEMVQDILDALTFVADRSGFQKEVKKILKAGLKRGQFAIRIGYQENKKEVKYVTEVDGEMVERSFKRGTFSMPYAKHVEAWNIFPDPYQGLLRYVTERGCVSYPTFIQNFGALIRSPFNKSPFKDEDFLKTLPINQRAADFTDFGAITSQIFIQKNSDAQATDSYLTTNGNSNPSFTSINTTQDQDTDVTKGLIEFKYYTEDGQIILHANGYPVYVGKNIFGFIPYICKSATDENMRLGCEGIPFILDGISQTVDSFANNMIDSARVLTTPTMIGVKGLFVNEDQLENAPPGSIAWIDPNVPSNGQRPLAPLDRGPMPDYSVIDRVAGWGQANTGISDYAQGVAARERTATGANAVANSAQKRLSPYLSSFVDCVSEIAQMWLVLMVQNWTTEQFIQVTRKSGEQIKKKLKNSNLAGDVQVSLELDGMMAVRNDLQNKRLIEMAPLAFSSGIVHASEYMAEIFKGNGMNPNKLILDYGKTKVDNPDAITPAEISNQSELAETMNPQLDLGNEGQGIQ